MFGDRQRITRVLSSGVANYVKRDNNGVALVNDNESYFRSIQERTFLSVRNILELSHREGNTEYYVLKEA